MDKPRILIIRTSALGDIVHALPALTALRRHFPNARIGWVVEEAFAPLLECHQDLDQVLTVRLRPWRRRPLAASTWWEMGRFVTELQIFGAEIALDLMGNHKGALIAALALCDHSIGLGRPWRREPSSALWLGRTVTPRGEHAVEQTLSVAEALGFPREPPDFGGERLRGLESSATKRTASEPSAVLLHPGTGWANKTYPPERWGEVVRRIGEATGRMTWLSAGPGEDELTQRVLAESNGHARELSDSSLPELVGQIRASALVLGGDTGPVHLAHALGVPVLCIMGPTDPARNGPYGVPGEALWHWLPCSFCHKQLDSVRACLLEIPAVDIAERAISLLEAR